MVAFVYLSFTKATIVPPHYSKATIMNRGSMMVAFMYLGGRRGPRRRRAVGQTDWVASPASMVAPAWAKLAMSAAAACPSGPPIPAAIAATSSNSRTATRW